MTPGRSGFHLPARVLSPGLLLALALALMAALPFLTRPGLPRGTDAELHVLRAAELGYALRWDNLYPRWAPHFYYGYGYPLYNYYAPLTYHLANLFDIWPGIDIVGGVKLVFILGLVSAALGIYLFVRGWLGPRPALLGAALYVFSPYVFFVDPHMRGVLAESFSLGLFPLALWAYSRLLADGRRRWVLAASLFQAALILSHNLMAVVFTALLLAYLAWELGAYLLALRTRGNRAGDGATLPGRPVWTRVAAALVLGLGLSAIFWLPVALEQDAVQLNLTGPGHFDFHNHFLALETLLAPSPSLDMRAAAPQFAFNLGLPQWPLALLALPALIWGPAEQRRRTGFFVLGAGALVLLMLPVSTRFWEAMPGMRFLQFPWRLLGPAAAMLSIAAASGLAFVMALLWNSKRGGRLVVESVPGLTLALTLFLALPAMYPPLWPADFGPTDPAAMIAFELSGVAVGTTSTGDYLPKTVEVSPHPEPAYLATFTSSGGGDRVNRATLPEGTRVEPVAQGPTYDRWHVSSRKPFILRLFTFYFPGWRATIDGRDVPIKLGRPEGFITVEVPSGEHTVEVRLGALATPGRALGTWLSLLALVAWISAGWRGPTFIYPVRWGARHAAGDGPHANRGRASCDTGRVTWWVAAGVLSLFFLVKTGVVDTHHDWFRYTSPLGEVRGAQHSLAQEAIDFGHHVRLLGYDLPRAEVRAGESLPLALYWQATSAVPDNYQVFVHLTRPAMHLWGQSDNLNPGDLPTQRWPLDRYVRDSHKLQVLPGTPPGEYQVTVGLYTLGSGARVPVYDAGGALLGDTFTLPATVRVVPSRRPPDVAALKLTDPVNTPFGDQVTLLGAVVPDRQIELPGFVHLALLWRADAREIEDFSVQLQLVAPDGRVVDEIVTAPVDGRYPASHWSPGEVVRDPYSFWLTEAFAPGVYRLRVRLPELDAGVSLGTIEVVAP